MTRVQLAPSILSADFGRLAEEIRSVSDHVDWFHLDVMDGHYVENLTFGPSTVAAVRAATDRPLHVHLMIEDPAAYAEAFAAVGADRISFHPEVTADPEEVAQRIRSAGAAPGVAVHPDVGVDAVAPLLGAVDVVLMMTVRPGFGGQAFLDEVVADIEKARELVNRGSFGADIEVDGGVNLSTVDRAVKAGAGIVVAGSAIFDGVDPPAAARRMRAKLDSLEGEG